MTNTTPANPSSRFQPRGPISLHISVAHRLVLDLEDYSLKSIDNAQRALDLQILPYRTKSSSFSEHLLVVFIDTSAKYRSVDWIGSTSRPGYSMVFTDDSWFLEIRNRQVCTSICIVVRVVSSIACAACRLFVKLHTTVVPSTRRNTSNGRYTCELMTFYYSVLDR